MKSEISVLEKMNTWGKILSKDELPPDVKPVDSKFIYKVKMNATGDIEKFKARLVARGFSQREGIDYDQISSPVVRYETLRYLLSYAVENDYEVHHVDIDSAFLYGELEEQIYLILPDAYRYITGNDNAHYCILHKSLYGLRQAGRNYFDKFTLVLKEFGFNACFASDICVHVLQRGSEKVIISHWVDDNIIIGPIHLIKLVKEMLSSHFSIKDLGQVKSFLGMSISRFADQIQISQSYYIQKVLNVFNMSDCNSVPTPAMPVSSRKSSTLARESGLAQSFDRAYYQKAIGCLTYLSMVSRPDISFSVNQVARALSNPTYYDWNRVKRIFRYLKGSVDLCLVYRKGGHKLMYSDSSYAENEDRKSTGGYVYLSSDAAVSWRSKKQSIIALSSAEAELIALSDSVKEALWLRKLIYDIEKNQTRIIIKEDNESTIKIANNFSHSDRTKHIDVRYYFIKDEIDSKHIQIQQCPTSFMTADIFTKALGRVLHWRHVEGLGLAYAQSH